MTRPKELATRFWYAVIRYVPDPAKQEQVNVGVVVKADDGRFLLRRNPERAAVFDAKGPRLVRRFLRDFKEAFPYGVVGDLQAEYRNLIQFSEWRPVAARSLSQAGEIVAKALL